MPALGRHFLCAFFLLGLCLPSCRPFNVPYLVARQGTLQGTRLTHVPIWHVGSTGETLVSVVKYLVGVLDVCRSIGSRRGGSALCVGAPSGWWYRSKSCTASSAMATGGNGGYRVGGACATGGAVYPAAAYVRAVAGAD